MFETEDGVVALDMETNTAEVVAAPHRQLLFGLIRGALRSEHGVRMRQAQGSKTDYYAGRRAGFIAASAQLIAVLYGEDYEEAKARISTGIRAASEACTRVVDLAEEDTSTAMAVRIVEYALSR